jgi:hypothetical protein
VEAFMNLTDEQKFLEKLTQTESFSKEKPVMDGEALVVTISHQNLICEMVVEVRLPGWINLPFDLTPSNQGFLWVYLQNCSDEALKLKQPDFLLKAGLKFPWQVGIEVMTNFHTMRIGEVLSWKVPITGNEDTEFLSSEVVGILNKCRTIVNQSYADMD